MDEKQHHEDKKIRLRKIIRLMDKKDIVEQIGFYEARIKNAKKLICGSV